MSKQRILEINCTQAEAEYRLKQQLRIYPPKGTVEENSFKLYKHTPAVFRANGLRTHLYCFSGEYHPSGKRTHMIYRIYPGISILLTFVLLVLFEMYMICRVVFADEPIITVFVLLGFLLFYALIMYVEKKKCIADFEKRLTTDISWKK